MSMPVQYPSAVSRRAKEADEAIKAFAQQAGAPAAPLEPPAPQAAPQAAPASPEVDEDDVEPNVAEDGGPEPDDKPKTITFIRRSEVDGQPAPVQGGAEDFRQKYLVLKGKYDTELPDIRRRLKAAEERNDDLRALLGNLSAREPEPVASPAPAPRSTVQPLDFKPVSEDEEKNFGKDYLDAAARAAMQRLDPVVRSMAEQIETLKGELAKTTTAARTAQQSTQRMTEAQAFQRLAQEVPEYETINTSEAYIAWLNEKDRFSGVPRHRLLSAAWHRGDIETVVQFFKAFKAEYVGVNEDGSTEQDTQRPPARRPVDKSTLVGPGRGRSASRNGTQQDKIQWTNADISTFFRDVATGRYKDNPAERERLERDIFDAQSENRVQP